VDYGRTKVGYEITMNRHFYVLNGLLDLPEVRDAAIKYRVHRLVVLPARIALGLEPDGGGTRHVVGREDSRHQQLVIKLVQLLRISVLRDGRPSAY
jgi:hypothetical protein